MLKVCFVMHVMPFIFNWQIVMLVMPIIIENWLCYAGYAFYGHVMPVLPLMCQFTI